jgi:alkylation response protein AidB-like acyl-CoA dehydrogenase
MDFEFTEEQRMVKDTVRRFLEKEMAAKDRKYGDIEMTREVAIELLAAIKPFGYIGHERSDDPIITSILFQEMGRVFPSLAGLAFIAGQVGPVVAGGAHPDVVARLAAPLTDGTLIGCFAFSEPDVGSDPSSIACRAQLEGDHYVVNGSKTWISNGHIADVAVVTVQTDPARGPAGLRQLVIDRKESPFESRDIPTIGLRAFPCSELHFSDVKVPAINKIGGWHKAEKAASAPSAGQFNFNLPRVLCADVACGIAEQAIEVATAYVQQRKQFGREIGRFQLVQGMLAEMVMDYEAARLLTFQARAAIGKPGADRKVSIAKAFATEMGVRVTSRAMECLGAMGLTLEMGLERRLRDARMWIVPDGTSQIQRLIIGRDVTGFSATRA